MKWSVLGERAVNGDVEYTLTDDDKENSPSPGPGLGPAPGPIASPDKQLDVLCVWLTVDVPADVSTPHRLGQCFHLSLAIACCCHAYTLCLKKCGHAILCIITL